MKKFLPTLFLLSLFFLFFPFGLAHAASISNAKVTIIGDSITVRSEENFKQDLPNATTINGVVGRPWADGVAELQTIKNSGKLEDILVFELGTNNTSSPITQSDVDQVLQLASGKQVVFVTVFGLNNAIPSMNQTNKAFADAASNHSNVAVADWNALVSTHTDWIEKTNPEVHPTIGTGTEQYAKLIADTVAQVAGNNTDSPNNSTDTTGTTVASCAITKVGNPAGPSPTMPPDCQSQNNGGSTNQPTNDIAKLASDLVPAAQNCNSGVIVSESILSDNATNYNCMKNKIPPSANYPTDAFNEIDESVHVFNGYYQCVGLAQTADSGINSSVKDPLNQVSITYAYQYEYTVPAGYVFEPASSGIYQEGDFAIWDSSQFGSDGAGHIAVVIQKLDQNDFVVAQANWTAHGKVDTMHVRVGDSSQSAFAGWLHKK